MYNLTQPDLRKNETQDDGLKDDTEEIEVDYDELSDVQFSKVEENEIKETPPCSGDDCSHENQDDMTWTASRPFSRSSLTLVIIYL